MLLGIQLNRGFMVYFAWMLQIPFQNLMGKASLCRIWWKMISYSFASLMTSFLENRLPPPSECDLYYVNRDTLFSYHKDSELFLQVTHWSCTLYLIFNKLFDRLCLCNFCSGWWRCMFPLITKTLLMIYN